jgi:23S rRNA U2552 (ribose-2'-O)-methylase RlmE/FtsJ
MATELSEATRRTIISRIPNYANMLQEDAAAAAIRVIADDFDIYTERNLMIEDKDTGEVIPFRLNWAQRKLVDLVMADIAAGVPVRYIILKARQMGLSTVIEAMGFWWTTTHRNIKTVIIAHETEAVDNLYDMFKRYFDNCRIEFQPDPKI